MTRQDIVDKLRTGIFRVTFAKLDGTLRQMPCTLSESLLPPATKSDPASQKAVRDISDEVLVVWCTDKAAWRSFRVANVMEITDVGLD